MDVLMSCNWEVMAAFETRAYAWMVTVLVCAPEDWVAVLEGERVVRRVWRMQEGVKVHIVRARRLTADERGMLMLGEMRPQWSRVRKGNDSLTNETKD